MSDKPVNSIPKQFGRYRIEKALGAGGMGAVYLAHDSQLNRNVAIKTPKFTEKSSKNLVKRFYREARSAATLQHPNICPVYDVGELDGIHYISMAYIEGRPLSDSMKSKTFPPVANIIRVIRKVALALHEAHAQGLIHRDLKPANIMIDRRGEPIVMDFGLAKQFGADESDDSSAIIESGVVAEMGRVEARLTMDGTIVGSPGYMSPEQLYGHNDKIGPTSDVYALGVLLFELLTRQLPFPGDGTLMSIVKSAISDPTPNASTVRSDIDPRFAAICQKAMAKKIDDRYQSMQSLAMALTDALKSGSGSSSSAKESDAGASPELVRTKEQYELAHSLYEDGQFAAAASIMEKMVAEAKAEANQYTTWAKETLPEVRDAAVAALSDDSTADDLWGGDTGVGTETSSRRKSKTRSKRRRSKWKKKSGLPNWAWRVVTTSVGIIALLLAAALIKAIVTMFTAGQSTADLNSNAEISDAVSMTESATEADGATPVEAEESDDSPEFRIGGPTPGERLRRLDTDGDGNISKSELESQRAPESGPLRRVIDNFDEFDVNPADGVLSEVEIQKIMELFARPGFRNQRGLGRQRRP